MSKTELGMKIIGTDLYLSANDKKLKMITERHGKTHTIEAVKGTTPLLTTLMPNQSVCWGDGETYHFRLTKLP